MVSRALDRAGEGLVQFRKIEAAKDIAATLAKSRGVQYIPSGSNHGGGGILLNVDANK